MDPVQDLTEATRLVFDLAFRYKIEALGITLEEKDRNTAGICLKKPTGKLEFTLNTKYLSIPALKTNFDIRFEGARLGLNKVEWHPVLPNGPVDIKTSKGDATITQIGGVLTTKHVPILPPLGDTACDGESQAHTLTFDSVGSANELSVEAQAFTAITLSVTSLTVTGRAGIPKNFAATLRQYPYSECVGSAVVNAMTTFSVLVTGVPPGTPVTITWTVDGGTIVGNANGTLIKVRMPGDPGFITVTAVVAVTEQNGVTEISTSLTAAVIAADVALAMERFCKLFMKARVNEFIRPLWDPLRSLVERPVTRPQGVQLQDFARNLSALARSLGKGGGRV